MKIQVRDAWMQAAAQIVAVQIQQDPEKGTRENLPRTIHQAYFAIWQAARRLELGSSLDEA